MYLGIKVANKLDVAIASSDGLSTTQLPAPIAATIGLKTNCSG